MNLRDQLKLYFVMGSPNCKLNPKAVLKNALEGGITLFQFREKGIARLTGESKLKFAQELQQLCKSYDIPFIVNDDVELALKLDADGVHIGQEDGPIEAVRRRIGSKILGVSTHNLEEAQAASGYGADYLGVGPMFKTTTKPDARKVRGPNVIRTIRESGISIPLVGIGGIHQMNVNQVLQAGADGVAIISSISMSDDPQQAAKRFVSVINESYYHKL